jgi:hypothetical protein
MPVTALNMNYGGPVMGAVILFALVDWFIWGRKRFSVPIGKVGGYEWVEGVPLLVEINPRERKTLEFLQAL